MPTPAWLEQFRGEFAATMQFPETAIVIDSADPDLEVRMDKSHLRQVLWNLCDNAVKYASETGGILVELRAGRGGANGRPYLEVLDHGLGVEPATAERIFEPFYTTKKTGEGTGLGLSMVERFARSLGGSMKISSQEGVGTGLAQLVNGIQVRLHHAE